MNSFWRFLLLALFCAVGIGLALCVALSAPSASEPMASEATAVPSDLQGNGRPQVLAPGSYATAATATPGQLEQANPRIASQASREDVYLAQANSVSSTPGLPVSPTELLNAVNLLQQSKSLGTPQSETVSQQTSSQADVMQKLREQLQRALQMKQAGAGGENQLPSPADQSAGGGASSSKTQNTPAIGSEISPKSKPRIVKLPGGGDNNLSIHIQDADLRDVLELLSEQGDLNILPSPTVQGKVSASLNGVNIDAALNAILRSTGYVAKHDGNFIYVGTPQDFKTMSQSVDTVGIRVYHLSYIRAADVQALVQPLLTPGIGTSSVTQPADEGIGADSDKAGGNQYANGDTVVVHDYVAVLNQVDQVIAEVDRKPAQVAIDAMILKVTLDDQYSFGVDFAFFRNNPNVHLFTGSPLSDLASVKPNGGLSFAFLDSNTAAFVNALEQIGDTNIIASPHLMVIDKCRASILIGNEDGYINSTVTETSTAQNVQFLETGAQLRLRPYITPDGMVRMEIHPELSTGNVEVVTGATPLTIPHKDVTQVTTNVMIPDGCTVVIGGLIRDELDTTTQQIPLLGSLPGVGFLFRHKSEETAKKEIIVLITPHIVCDSTACCEGDRAAADFHRRQAVYADQMSPLGKRYLGRKYYRLAQAAWARQDQQAALRFVDLAIHFDPLNRAAIDLRVDIWNGNLTGQHTLLKPPMMPQPDGMPMLDSTEDALPGEQFDGPSGMSGVVPQGVPFGDPPRLQGLPIAPDSSSATPPGSISAPSATTPRKLEPIPQGRPSPEAQQTTPVPSAASVVSNPSITPASAAAASNSTAEGTKPPANAAHALDGNHISPWIINQLKQPSPVGSMPAAIGDTGIATTKITDVHAGN